MSDPKIEKTQGGSGRLNLARYPGGGFDRGRPLPVEALWTLASLVFFLPPVPLPSALRAALLRLFGAQIGARTVIRAGTRIKFPWKLQLGDDVWLGEGVEILNLAPVSIAHDCCLSQGSFLCTGSHDFSKPSFDLVTGEIRVGPAAWIAARAFLGPGVEIGEGSMVGAGAVVTGDIPPGHYARGNPSSHKPIGAADGA